MTSSRLIRFVAVRGLATLLLPLPGLSSFHNGIPSSHHSRSPFSSPQQFRKRINQSLRHLTTSNNANDRDNNKEGSSSNTKVDLEQLAQRLDQFQNIVVVLGAGISVSAGIPDFRTPGTGLYSKLEDYKLPYPEAIFELSYFSRNPAPFVDVARAIWPGQADGPKPTLAHSFVALLEQRGLLKRVYTQNIDGLERLAGLSDARNIECHGHFSACSCISPRCKSTVDILACQDAYLQGQVMKCPTCGSFVKPNIVFFGEELPPVFMDHVDQDMADCDLLIVMGTSLLVNPVASIPKWVRDNVPRLLINRDLVGAFAKEALMQERGQLQSRDVVFLGDCDAGVQRLCELAGKEWVQQLDAMHGSITSSRHESK
jgi:NAD-dependent SIR2 family protein deacetylase